VIAGRALYEDGTLFHGPSFQGIDSILRMDEEGLTMRCHLPRLPWEMQGQFYAQTFNPFVVDAQLQSLLVWSRHYLGAAGLPLRIAGGTLYRPLHFDEVTYVTMRVRSHSVRNVVADVMVQDEQGAVIMEVGCGDHPKPQARRAVPAEPPGTFDGWGWLDAPTAGA